MVRLASLAALNAATLLAVTPAYSAAPQVATIEVGSAQWDKMPALKVTSDRIDYPAVTTAISNMLESRLCKLAGQSSHRFDISVPYAVLVTPEGKAERVLVSETGCAALEDLVGEMAIAQSDAGVLLPTGDSRPRWYADTFAVALR